MTKKATIQGDFYGYSISDGGKKTFQPIGRAILINSIQRVIETGEIFFEVSFNYCGNNVIERFPRQNFNRSGLMKLQTKGADVFEYSFPCLIDILKEQEAAIKIENINQGLGWYLVPSKKYHDKMVTVFRSNYISYLQSTYTGNFDIEPIRSQE